MTNIRILTFGLGPLLFFVWINPVQDQKEIRGAQKTAFATCWEEKTKKYGSQSIQGTIFVSPDGLQQAYVKIDTKALGKDSSGQESCQNRSALFVAKDGQEHFDSVFTYQREKGETGNGIQLIDWSPDSKVLVADLLTWYYSSEGWEHHMLVYSAQTGVVQKKSLEDLFSRALHKDCGLEAQIKGFLLDGRVAVKARPLDEEEGPSCVSKDSLWAIDISTFKISPLTGKEAIKQNGQFTKPD
jgi:hypothetical protein